MKGRILIIDDEEKLRRLLARILSLEGFEVLEAGTGAAALLILEKEEVEVVISDVRLPDTNGIELTKRIKHLRPQAEVLVLTAFGTIQDGVSAMKNGAFDYIVKGDDNERIIPLIERALERRQLTSQVAALTRQLRRDTGFDSIIGQAQAMQQAVALARKVAPTDATVLLTGETGTGKEVFAQAIHHESPRRLKPFLPINCSALGKDILESELFGHRAGAFTGAVKDKKGLLEEANGGTLFLDEIGEMPPDLQAKLLRVLETRSFIKVGDTRPIQVDIRVLAATNRDLLAEAERERFREDLYYRLSVFQIRLPSLRERPEDIETLTRHFIRLFATRMNKPVREASPELLEQLRAYAWKGNVRELRNMIERAMILAEGPVLTADVLEREWQPVASIAAPVWNLAEVEWAHIQKTLAFVKGQKPEAARLLGIGLTTLYRKIEEHGSR